ncbi:hypothetical protein [Escherichia coli]|uniref:hypothetical protein n=1 Tax=Escherichia coli TaxID=562 RepID=UPI0011BA7E56|nr:hypothetical protein [Escherichia coli]
MRKRGRRGRSGEVKRESRGKRKRGIRERWRKEGKGWDEEKVGGGGGEGEGGEGGKGGAEGGGGGGER